MLHSHQQVFVNVLRVLRCQLSASLGGGSSCSSEAAGGLATRQQQQGEGEGGGASPFGLPLVEELLPDSFLKVQCGSFLQLLQVRAEGWGRGLKVGTEGWD